MAKYLELYNSEVENVSIELNIELVDTRDIAIELSLKHRNLIDLIKKEKTNLLLFGELHLSKENVAIGRPLSFYMLNKFHTMYILCLCKNTEKVKQLKIDFIKYFYKYAPNI